jgi:ElaB/YqjD/DUF883 family membrane-anchored ribosome-binding protein
MFRNAPYSRAIAADMATLERRLRSLEQRLERSGGSLSSTASQAVDRVGEVIASSLGDMADRFRGSARSMGGEAMKLSGTAAKAGNDVIQRLADEVERRPIAALIVVAGIGILLGLAGRRH